MKLVFPYTDKTDISVGNLSSFALGVRGEEQIDDGNAAKIFYDNYWNLSFENYDAENCAEIWSARNAIMAGAKYENIAFKCLNRNDDKRASPCDNCKCTFEIEHSSSTQNPRLPDLGGE